MLSSFIACDFIIHVQSMLSDGSISTNLRTRWNLIIPACKPESVFACRVRVRLLSEVVVSYDIYSSVCLWSSEVRVMQQCLLGLHDISFPAEALLAQVHTTSLFSAVREAAKTLEPRRSSSTFNPFDGTGVLITGFYALIVLQWSLKFNLQLCSKAHYKVRT